MHKEPKLYSATDAEIHSKDASTLPLHIGHRQRMRQRLLHLPKEAFSDLDILEMLLCYARPRQDVRPLAMHILQHFGSLAKVINAPIETLHSIQGVNETLLGIFKLIQEASCRLVKEEMRNTPVLQSWKALLDYCRASMAHLVGETLRILYLNKKHALLAEEAIETGTVDQVPIYPREVVKRALFWNACGVILVHNHPTGDHSPLQADIVLTKKMRQALSSVEINLIDHLIISDAGHFSFRNHGLL